MFFCAFSEYFWGQTEKQFEDMDMLEIMISIFSSFPVSPSYFLLNKRYKVI